MKRTYETYPHQRIITITTKTFLLISLLLLLLLFQSTIDFVEGKEIVATREWQEIKEGDTIPAGLHVKMDLSTGKKWARLDINDEEEEEDAKETATENVEVDSFGNSVSILPESSSKDPSSSTQQQQQHQQQQQTSKKKPIKITHLPDTTITPETSAKIRDQLLAQEQKRRLHESIAALDDHTNADPSLDTSDIETMYRALSGLPSDEIERMGGLPLRPNLIDNNSTDRDLEREMEEFESAVRRIWTERQVDLKKIEEEYLANIPEILKERIHSMRQYLDRPREHLRRLLLHDDEVESSEGMENEEEEENGADIVWVLEDLDFQLMDIDMARDFHTMGGWPLLVSLLTDSAHGLVQMKEEKDLKELVWKIQGLASSTIGSAVRNVEEFYPWALETFDDDKIKGTNVLSVLVEGLKSYTAFSSSLQKNEVLHKKIYKQLNALGALLRGNAPAITYFTTNDSGEGAQSLSRIATSLLLPNPGTTTTTTTTAVTHYIGVYAERLLQRIVTLAHDILVQTSLDDDGDSLTRSTFTTEEWCSIPKLVLSSDEKVDVDGGMLWKSKTKEGVLHAAIVMAKDCGYRKSDFGVVPLEEEDEEMVKAWETFWMMI